MLWLCLLLASGVAQAQTSPKLATAETIYTSMTDILKEMPKPGNSCDYHLHVVIGWDISGSMNGTLRETFLEAWGKLLKYFFQPGDTFTLIPFDNRVQDPINKEFTNPADLKTWFGDHTITTRNDGTCFFEAQKAILEAATKSDSGKAPQKQPDSKSLTLVLMVTDETEPDLKKNASELKLEPAVEKLAATLSQDPNTKNLKTDPEPYKLAQTNPKGKPLSLYLYYLAPGDGSSGKASGQVQRYRQKVAEGGSGPKEGEGGNPTDLIKDAEPTPQPSWNGGLLLLGAVSLLGGIGLAAYGLTHMRNLKERVKVSIAPDNVLSGSGERTLTMQANTPFTLRAGTHDAQDPANTWRININGASEDPRALITLNLEKYPHYDCRVQPAANVLVFDLSEHPVGSEFFINNGETDPRKTGLKIGFHRNALATVHILPAPWKEGKDRQLKSMLAFAGPGLILCLLGVVLGLLSRPHAVETQESQSLTGLLTPEPSKPDPQPSDRESVCQ